MGEATTTPKMDYFRMPRPLWRKLKKYLPKPRKRKAPSGRPEPPRGRSPTPSGTCFGRDANGRLSIAIGSGSPPSVVHQRFQRWRSMGIFEKLMKRMAEYYARECGGIGWDGRRWTPSTPPAPLGGQKTGKNPTDRGKVRSEDQPPGGRAGRSHLNRAHRSQPPRQGFSHGTHCLGGSQSVQRTKNSTYALTRLMTQDDLRRFGGLHRSHQGHSPVAENPSDGGATCRARFTRRGDGWWSGRSRGWTAPEPAHCWAKKAENWLALVQLACAHILLNLAVFG